MNMKEKAKEWWNKPITNGDQVKSGLKGMAAYAVMFGGLVLIEKLAEKRATHDDVIDFNDYVNEEDITG